MYQKFHARTKDHFISLAREDLNTSSAPPHLTAPTLSPNSQAKARLFSSHLFYQLTVDFGESYHSPLLSLPTQKRGEKIHFS